ncbi:NnrS family protein (plasmid) [Sulfuricurvum kujiense DSM 16994]|uniref:NnrS family protein n=1 Tax=Sulfuricurvum kujiense (strain ATCC BAA-921 / DSM 16994 / JCM 11577 / YK-1) TaxID=709032 RepID=E4U3J3_SULKY|nr:NnrS family protein [Sulfuricurvum kujiense]ADR35259.1 NnrS family protein [Sulfuricurvum kujiense DSM 16994]
MSTFSTTAQKKQNYFLSQPHQPFFVFGVLWAIASMVLFTLSHKGVIPLAVSEREFHLYSLAFIVFAQFFHGFLFTTFPRFCTAMTIPKEVYIRIVWLYQIASILFFIGSLVSPWMVLVAMCAGLFAHVMAIFTLHWVYKIGQSPLKQDPYWILIAHGIALASHLLWIIAYGISLIWDFQGWFEIIVPIIVNFFFVFLTFSVAQRMIPFFSHSQEAKSNYFVETVFGFLIIKTLLAMSAFAIGEAVISILLALYLLREFLRWNLHPFHSPAIVWILHLALFWLPAGLLIGGILQIIEALTSLDFLFAGAHLLVLGFLTTVLIGFGTRVTLGHSGQPPYADKLTIALFWWTQIIVLARLVLSIDTALGASHGWLFDIASTGWILLFIAWSIRYGETLIFGKKTR